MLFIEITCRWLWAWINTQTQLQEALSVYVVEALQQEQGTLELRRPDRTCTFHYKHNTIPHRLTSVVHSVNGKERLVLTGKNPEGNLKGLHMWVPTPTRTTRILFSTKYGLERFCISHTPSAHKTLCKATSNSSELGALAAAEPLSHRIISNQGPLCPMPHLTLILEHCHIVLGDFTGN